jgi:hypothetical protein
LHEMLHRNPGTTETSLPERARRLARRTEPVYTPMRGPSPNAAGEEPSGFVRRYPKWRVADIEALKREATARA